jgi:hypothetical protein
VTVEGEDVLQAEKVTPEAAIRLECGETIQRNLWNDLPSTLFVTMSE